MRLFSAIVLLAACIVSCKACVDFQAFFNPWADHIDGAALFDNGARKCDYKGLFGTTGSFSDPKNQAKTLEMECIDGYKATIHRRDTFRDWYVVMKNGAGVDHQFATAHGPKNPWSPFQMFAQVFDGCHRYYGKGIEYTNIVDPDMEKKMDGV